MSGAPLALAVGALVALVVLSRGPRGGWALAGRSRPPRSSRDGSRWLARWAGPFTGALGGLRQALTARREGRERQRAILDRLPDVVDLFGVAARSGLTVPLAVESVATEVDEPFATALGEIRRRVALGSRWADELESLASLGEGVRPLARALVASERFGAPLADQLALVGADARAARRRAAEEAARRLPVQLLFPLVLCILPAFGLLTVVPLLVGALGSLDI